MDQVPRSPWVFSATWLLQTFRVRQAKRTASHRLPHANVFWQPHFPGSAPAYRAEIFPDNMGREPGATGEPLHRACRAAGFFPLPSTELQFWPFGNRGFSEL